MSLSNFLNAFYSEDIDEETHKMKMKVYYDAKCSYFDDLKCKYEHWLNKLSKSLVTLNSTLLFTQL